MGKYKAKAIQTGFGTFRHSQAYPGSIQACSELCVTLAYLEPWYNQNPYIFRTKSIFPWYFQNPGTFRTLGYSESEAYLNPVKHLHLRK